MNVINLEEFKLKRLAIFATPAEEQTETEDIAAALDDPSSPPSTLVRKTITPVFKGRSWGCTRRPSTSMPR